MRRLLQGDVGSGKTAVAAVALAAACRSGWQAALMAPTEILARQHHGGLEPLLSGMGVRAEFLSGSLPAARKREIHAALEAGEAEVVIGTHAVISEGVTFRALGLAVVDEQHRFGVAQRGGASGEGGKPRAARAGAHRHAHPAHPGAHLLRGPGDQHHPRAAAGPPSDPDRDPGPPAPAADPGVSGKRGGCRSPVFVVVPLIVESEALEAASAEAEAERLRAALPQLRIGLVHGQQRASDRDATMRPSPPGKLDLLVATTVIEVGIDVPNASVMLVEDAERFGLAQLHQLRGRVGRGEHRSFCILLSDAADERSRERLRVLSGSSDGFAIAEADLAAARRRRPARHAAVGPAPLRVSPRSSIPATSHSPSVRVSWRHRLVAVDPTSRSAPRWRGAEDFARASGASEATRRLDARDRRHRARGRC